MMNAALEPAVQAKINSWIDGPYDEETKRALQVQLDEGAFTELTDAFYKDLEFGTGGLRGIMGNGTNRINKYTLGAATQGLSNYLKKKYPGQKIKVVVAHDSRNNSDRFAKLVAEVFSANDILVYFFEGLRPTPELSFAIRKLGCQSGVMLTASHNPKEYNGYKAYGEDGGQLVSPADVEVIEEVRKINDVRDIQFARVDSNIEVIGRDMDDAYLDELVALSLAPDAIRRQQDLKIVFSPIHGTGGVLVPPILEKFGFTNVTLVTEQMSFDGDFPTVIYPNPEEKEALSLALQLAAEIDADLVMATDPDADRVGIAVKNHDGNFEILNGNQTCCLLVHYVMNSWQNLGKLTGDQYVVKTVVTSYMIDKIAESKNIPCFNTLTGFKYIGQIMTNLEGKKTFLAGGEESYGYLVGEHARDKDAVVSCAMIAEMAAFYKDQGRSVFDALIDLYLEYGFYKEKLIALTKKGKSGAEEIQNLMANLRQSPPAMIGGSSVVQIKDYLTSTATNPVTGEQEPIDMPTSNVLQFFTEDGSIVSARPSGTEPKIKFYCSVNAPLASKEEYKQVEAKLDEKLELLLKDLGV